jgi:DNA helicase II / ATP-dependent DNA helicase PcrA
VSFTPTEEQLAIVNAALDAKAGSIMVESYAGCSKTTTLELTARALVEKGEKSILYLVFGVKNKQEAEDRMPPEVNVKTINGLGHGAWIRRLSGKKINLDDKKLTKIVSLVEKESGSKWESEQWIAIRDLASKAMMSGIVPRKFAPTKGLVPDKDEIWSELCEDVMGVADPLIVAFARMVVEENIRQALLGTISFDDQIYMSALFGGIFPRYNIVMVDEAQDQSPLNILMIAKCAGNRIFAVGDEKQAIYAFRGAAGDALLRIRTLRDRWIDLPLHTTFRCSKVIVARQQGHAPGFAAWHANAEGEHFNWAQEPWTWDKIPHNASEVILCRNNAPLLKMAFKLLANSVGVTMLGRDIGKSLIALAKKLCSDASMPAETCAATIADWRDREVMIALANQDDAKAESIRDKSECLFAVISSGCKNAQELFDKLQDLFSRESGSITLSSIHKSKGLEWHTVLHLDPWRIPSRYALTAGGIALQQDLNLRYVCETRAKARLVEVSLDNFKGMQEHVAQSEEVVK